MVTSMVFFIGFCNVKNRNKTLKNYIIPGFIQGLSPLMVTSLEFCGD